MTTESSKQMYKMTTESSMRMSKMTTDSPVCMDTFIIEWSILFAPSFHRSVVVDD